MDDLGFDKPPGATRVVVAMSGGVDSSVTAALLQERGYEVIGATLLLRDYGLSDEAQPSCRTGQEIDDARAVAGRLGIAHHVLDLKTLFRDTIMEDFADSYLRGETPVPCVACNRTIKFGALWAFARSLGADAIATGHYVRWRRGPQGAELHRGADAVRDQSYFLFATSREQLGRLRFPLGGMVKSETREHAKRFGLAVAEKPDSQDICFVRGGSYAGVVEAMRPGALSAGDIVDMEGRVLGRHDGVVRYTVGQRRGLGVAAAEPQYVVRLEPDTGRVVVGPRKALACAAFRIRDLNWIGDGDAPADGARVAIKVRSAMAPVPAAVRPGEDGGAEVVPDQPIVGVAPGQACVMYDGDRLVGGGWIVRR